MPTLTAAQKGDTLPQVTFDLTSDWVQEYVAAVGDEAIGRLPGGLVPPMAVAALAVRALLEKWGLPPGTLHAGQELAFTASVRENDTLSVTAHVASRGERAGWVLMGIELVVARGPENVMTGRATISFPVDAGVAV